MPKMLHLSQRDARWASKKIGKTSLTVGRWGCTLTCISMLSSYFGCYKSPAELAAIPGLFNAEGLILWGEIEKVFGGRFKFLERVGNRTVAKRDDKKIRASLLNAPETCVILEVANHSHWVVAIGTYGNDYYIIDPIDGKKKLAVRTFGNITGSAHLVGKF